MRIARWPAAVAAIGSVVGSPSLEAQDVDVLRYDLDVTVRESDLAATTTIRAAGRPPSSWTLELTAEMKVLSAEAGGKAVPFAADGRRLALDLRGVPDPAGGEFAVVIRTEGSPSERFPADRGGFVRSAVGPGVAYVRSQVPWYPRLPDDPAVHRTVVDARSGWQVRTAGEFGAPSLRGERSVWTFETKGPVAHVGLAAGPWRSREAAAGAPTFDALVFEGHEDEAQALLPLARKAYEFFAKDLSPLARGRFTLVEVPEEFGSGSGYSEHGYFLLGPGAFEAGPTADWVPPFLAHELSHQWWGHEVPASDFVNEALAEYASLRFAFSTEGGGAALRRRRAAVEGVVAAAAAGKEVALSDIRGWGGEMDPETYRAHAYGKAMMILAMAEEALGEAAMKRLIGGFLRERRGASATWAGLREALAGAHPEARSVVEQWEKPGIPSLRVEFRAQRSGGALSVTGKVLQGGTPKPFRMAVPLVAVCGEKRVEAVVKLSGAEAPFSLKCPAEPEAVILDPEFRLLAARPAAPGAADAKKAFEDAMRVANSPGEADPRTLEATVARLRSLAEADALSGGERAACRTGIGRCLFRLGKIEEAEVELEAALRAGAGGPFHRGWVHLRLGNIADLRGRRKEAVEHYESVIRTSGSSSSAVERAKRCLERAYRGYKVDG